MPPLHSQRRLIFAAPIVDAGEAQPTSEDDPFESEDARNAALIEALETAESAGGLTDITNLYLAGALWDAGQEDRAFDLTKRRASSLKPSDPIGFLAHQRLALARRPRCLDGAVATLRYACSKGILRTSRNV